MLINFQHQQNSWFRSAYNVVLLATSLILVMAGNVQAAPPTSNSVDILTLNQALDIALHENRILENAAMEINKAADSVAAEETRRLPKLQVGVVESYSLTPLTYTYPAGIFGVVPKEDVSIDAKSDFTTIASASIQQPLTELYRIGLSIDQKMVMEEVADQQLRSHRHAIVKDVKKAYYDILKTQNSLTSTEESIAFYRELDQLLERYLKEQTVLKYQVLEVDSRLAIAEHKAFRERNELPSQQEKLNNLLARDITQPFSVVSVGVENTPIPTQKDVETIALGQRPEIKEAQLKLKHAEYGYKIKKSEYLPDVDLQFRYTRLYNTEFIPEKESAIGLTARWEFYDWGRKSQDLSKKSYSIRQARNEIREAESQILIEVNESLRQLEDAQNLIPVTSLTQTAAREKLRVLMNQYRVQQALLDDVLKAETELTDANTAHNNALLSVWTKQAELQKAMGSE